MEMKHFERIEVYDGHPSAGGELLSPEALGIDAEYVEQEKAAPWYVQNLFSELWETGKYGSDSFGELVGRCYAVGVAYTGERYYLGPCSGFGVDVH